MYRESIQNEHQNITAMCVSGTELNNRVLSSFYVGKKNIEVTNKDLLFSYNARIQNMEQLTELKNEAVKRFEFAPTEEDK